MKAHTSASARSGEERVPPLPALAGLVNTGGQLESVSNRPFSVTQLRIRNGSSCPEEDLRSCD